MKTVALTGASGNMGREVLRELCILPELKIRILQYDKDRRFINHVRKSYPDVEIIYGSITDEEICNRLADGADYVINCAAVIPPKSDKSPELAVQCNYYGVKTLLDAIKSCKKQPKLIHVSTVALYGNRNHLHPWGRVGDPLMPSVFDPYSRSKLFGERLVLESGLEYWTVLRQTGILHERMLSDNISDGLMFHTCLNTPLEWVTAKDSGVLIRKIIKKDIDEGADIWRKVYNIGGGAGTRITGYETFNDGFAIIGGSAKSFLSPEWHAARNFHGVWFSDSDELEKMFGFRNQSCADYWREFSASHAYYKVAKAIPAGVIRRLAIERLLTNYNSPKQWRRENNSAKVKAYFGDEVQGEDWQSFPLLCEGHTPQGEIDYDDLRDETKVREHGFILDHGFDESKPVSELDIEDMRKAAEFRGGKCLSAEMKKGDLYTPLLWECSEGHRFFATPYTVLFAGHWCEECFKDGWNYDVTASKSKFYAQVYYDSHDRAEHNFYYYDKGTERYREAI